MFESASHRIVAPHRGRTGFTLVEILVALAVMSIAITIGVSLYVGAASGCFSNRSELAAASIAEEALAVISSNPGGYVWDPFLKAPAGELIPVAPKDAKDPHQAQAASLPATVNPQSPRDKHEASFYQRFTWRAFARSAKEDPGLVEVSVAVQWNQQGKPRCVTLTTAVPRSAVEGRS